VYWRNRLPPGGRRDALVRLIDIFPTLAELAGVAAPPDLDGRSLAGLLTGTTSAGSSEAYAETYLPATAAGAQRKRGTQPVFFGYVRRSMRTERWKYIRNEPSRLVDVQEARPLPEALRTLASEELYDLSGDPGEEHNVIPNEPDTATTLRRKLEDVLNR